LTGYNNTFFSLFGEVGVDVPINHMWHVTMAYNGRYNFLAENKNLSSDVSMNGASWKLGLGYQF